MQKKLWLTPKPGELVRDPVNGQHLPPEGAEKPLDMYWRRRLKDGAVTEGKPQAAAKPAPKKEG